METQPPSVYRLPLPRDQLTAAYEGLPDGKAVGMPDAVRLIRSTIYDLYWDGTAEQKLGATEIDLQKAIGAAYGFTLLQVELEAAIEYLAGGSELISRPSAGSSIRYSLTPEGQSAEESGRQDFVKVKGFRP
jgi:hypothetical protein